MAVTVTDDLTTLDLADSAAAWNTTTPMSSQALDPDSKVEGTNCIEARIGNGGGVGLLNCNHGSVDLTDAHIYAWMRQSMIWGLFTNGGVRFRIATSALGTTAYGQWNTLGQDKGVASFKGWVSGVIDPLKPFQSINGTPPAITAVVSTGFEINWLTGNGKALAIADYVKYGGKIFIKGGGVATEGTFAEISAADETAGRGLLKLVGGVSFVNCGIDFGDTATLTTRFIDSLTTVVFEDFQVAGGFYKIAHVGNATGTNLVTFGSSSGTGATKEGSAGIGFSSAGAAPFWIEAIDANIDNAEYYGCNLTGPPAIYDDQVRNFKQEDNSGASFVDLTREAGNATANDAQPFPTGSGVNDAAYFGANERFYTITVNTGTAGAGTYTVTWEYYNGTAWAALTDVTDGTSAFKTTAAQVVSYSIPDDWAANAIDTDTRYWIRARRDGGTVTTNPDITQVTIQMAGDVRWEDPAAEMIGCVLTNMGSVRLRNGAFLKKSIVTGSLASAKHAAVDLGSADPTTDTFRDMTISGNTGTNGILLKGTSTGTTTYNFRNIILGNNLKHVRVDFPAGATIVINVLEGGTGFAAGDVDNVNASTLTINAGSTTKVTITNAAGTVQQNARVFLETNDAGATSAGLPYQDAVTSLTQAAGTATLTATAVHDLVTGDKVVVRGAAEEPYNSAVSITVSSPTVFTYAIDSAATSPAGGTPVFSYVPIQGLTDVNGEISSTRVWPEAQSLVGWGRKNSASPFLKQSAISIADASGGTDLQVALQSDE